MNKMNIKSVVAMGVTALMLGRLFPLLTVISFKCVGTLPPISELFLWISEAATFSQKMMHNYPIPKIQFSFP